MLILAHLTAVFAPPMAFQARGPRGLSPSVASLLSPVSSYSQFLYMDRGYAFFAPDPGPSHLMEVEILTPEPEGEPASDSESTSDSEPTSRSNSNPPNRTTERFPSLEKQWPRLLYHRHFMLAEFLNDAYQPALPIEAAQFVGPDLPAEELRDWRRGRQRYEAIVGSMIRHASQRTGGDPANKMVQVKRIEHLIPDFVGFTTRAMPLNDPDSYLTFEDIPITLETLLGRRPESLPQPGFAEPDFTDPSLVDPVATEPVPAPSGERTGASSSRSAAPTPAPASVDEGVSP